MSPNEMRKQLLLAESELNRFQLVDDVRAVQSESRALMDRARSFGSIASSAALLLSGLAAFRRPRPSGARHPWWQLALNGAGLASTLWLAYRARARPPG